MSNRFPNNLNTAQGFPTNCAPPFGYNDNNLNRQRFPSNVYPQNGGNQGNPFGRYNPMTTNESGHVNQFTNFDLSYAQPDQIIEKINYRNQNHILHNNVGEYVLDPSIVEYRVDVDSLDRDINVYPDPLDFIVKFNPIPSGIVSTEINERGKLRRIDEYFAGTPRPHIGREFRNVKYVKLDTAILPQRVGTVDCDKNKDDEDEISLKEEFYDEDNLMNDRFISLVVKELTQDQPRYYSTMDDSYRILNNGTTTTPPKPFSNIVRDKILGPYHYCGIPFYGSALYKRVALGNLKQMSIQFYDSTGQKLQFNNLFTARQLKEADEAGCPISVKNPRHPLNRRHQVFLSFIVGVDEANINQDVKYEK